MRMRICAYTLCARMLISMYKLAELFFLLLIVDCSFNDPTLRHLKVHGRMNKSCRAKGVYMFTFTENIKCAPLR